MGQWQVWILAKSSLSDLAIFSNSFLFLGALVENYKNLNSALGPDII